MAQTPFDGSVDLFAGTSAQSSTYTSDDIFIHGLSRLAVSWHSMSTTSSVLTIQGSLDQGEYGVPMTVGPGITYRSNITALISAGIYTLDPGLRWIRAQRGSEESLCVVRIAGS